MVLQNLPYLENETSVEIWKDATNNHVSVYWNNRPLSPINVVSVNTVLLQQENVTYANGQRLRRLESGEVASQLRIYYEQNITFSYSLENDRIEDNEDVIFLDPFERAEATYVDALVVGLNLGQKGADISILRLAVLDGSPSPPPTTSPIPTSAPGNFVSNADGGLSVAAIAIIATVLLVVLTGGLCGYLYLRKRQHAHDMAWAADHARSMQREDEFSPEVEDYPTVVQSEQSSPREMHIVDEGDEDSKDDDEMNAYSTGPSEAYHNDLPCDDDNDDDPTLPYTRDAGHQVRGSVSYDDSSQVLDVDNDDEIHPVSPLEATSSSGGSVNDPPSMWAFQVKVTDLDD